MGSIVSYITSQSARPAFVLRERPTVGRPTGRTKGHSPAPGLSGPGGYERTRKRLGRQRGCKVARVDFARKLSTRGRLATLD